MPPQGDNDAPKRGEDGVDGYSDSDSESSSEEEEEGGSTAVPVTVVKGSKKPPAEGALVATHDMVHYCFGTRDSSLKQQCIRRLLLLLLSTGPAGWPVAVIF